MPIVKHRGGTTITGPSVGIYRLLMLRTALQLEISTGIRTWRRGSPYTILKKELGLRGNRASVLKQATEAIAEMRDADPVNGYVTEETNETSNNRERQPGH